MRTLLIRRPLPLLLLLMLPSPLNFQKSYLDYFNTDLNDEFKDYLEEVLGTGPTKPPTLEKIKKWIIADDERYHYSSTTYCLDEIMNRGIHYKFRCFPEHYFVLTTYEELQKACYGVLMQCNSPTGKCRRSLDVIEGVGCTLVEGTRMGLCEYRTDFLSGHPIVFCKFDNETDAFIPLTINGYLIDS